MPGPSRYGRPDCQRRASPPKLEHGLANAGASDAEHIVQDDQVVTDRPVILAGAAPGELRELNAWLLHEDDLQGRIQFVGRGPEPGQLGPVLEGLKVFAEPSAAVLASALVIWIRHRRSSVRVTVTGPAKDTVTVQADRIRLMDAAQVAEFTQQVARVARGEPAAPALDGTGPSKPSPPATGFGEPADSAG